MNIYFFLPDTSNALNRTLIRKSSKKNGSCWVCGHNYGQMIPCDAEGCCEKFHPRCARSIGLIRRYDLMDRIKSLVFCTSHLKMSHPEQYEKRNMSTRLEKFPKLVVYDDKLSKSVLHFKKTQQRLKSPEIETNPRALEQSINLSCDSDDEIHKLFGMKKQQQNSSTSSTNAGPSTKESSESYELRAKKKKKLKNLEEDSKNDKKEESSVFSSSSFRSQKQKDPFEPNEKPKNFIEIFNSGMIIEKASTSTKDQSFEEKLIDLRKAPEEPAPSKAKATSRQPDFSKEGNSFGKSSPGMMPTRYDPKYLENVKKDFDIFMMMIGAKVFTRLEENSERNAIELKLIELNKIISIWTQKPVRIPTLVPIEQETNGQRDPSPIKNKERQEIRQETKKNNEPLFGNSVPEHPVHVPIASPAMEQVQRGDTGMMIETKETKNIFLGVQNMKIEKSLEPSPFEKTTPFQNARKHKGESKKKHKEASKHKEDSSIKPKEGSKHKETPKQKESSNRNEDSNGVPTGKKTQSLLSLSIPTFPLSTNPEEQNERTSSGNSLIPESVKVGISEENPKKTEKRLRKPKRDKKKQKSKPNNEPNIEPSNNPTKNLKKRPPVSSISELDSKNQEKNKEKSRENSNSFSKNKNQENSFREKEKEKINFHNHGPAPEKKVKSSKDALLAQPIPFFSSSENPKMFEEKGPAPSVRTVDFNIGMPPKPKKEQNESSEIKRPELFGWAKEKLNHFEPGPPNPSEETQKAKAQELGVEKDPNEGSSYSIQKRVLTIIERALRSKEVYSGTSIYKVFDSKINQYQKMEEMTKNDL